MSKKSGYLQRTLEFHKNYKSKIAPIFRSYEAFRKKELAKFWFMIISGILMLCSFPLMLLLSDSILSDIVCDYFVAYLILMMIFMTLGILLLFIAPKKIKNYAMKIKSDCLSKLLKVFGDIQWQNGKNIINDWELNRSALFSNFNTRYTDDEFSGSFNGVPFKICETNLLQISGSGKSRTYIPVFKGVVIQFKSNKIIRNRTMIATKGDFTAKNSWLLLWLRVSKPFIQMFHFAWLGLSMPLIQMLIEHPAGCLIAFVVLGLICWGGSKISYKDEEKLDEVKLEDPEFCKKFNAYSSDQVEARYLLTTAFIERFQNLNTAFGAKKAKCSFYGDKIMFAISTNKNLFEVGSLFKSLEKPGAVNQFYNELASIYSMIDYFKLDEKVGL